MYRCSVLKVSTLFFLHYIFIKLIINHLWSVNALIADIH